MPFIIISKFHGRKLKHITINYPDANLDKHCQLIPGKDTLYTPEPGANSTVKAAEVNLQEAVARYAEDNLLVVRVRKTFDIELQTMISCVRFS